MFYGCKNPAAPAPTIIISYFEFIYLEILWQGVLTRWTFKILNINAIVQDNCKKFHRHLKRYLFDCIRFIDCILNFETFFYESDQYCLMLKFPHGLILLNAILAIVTSIAVLFC
jgi:hypothetical protein